MNNRDIIKGVVYDRGEATHNGETRYLTLVAMIIASSKPITTTHNEFIVMGSANIANEIDKLTRYKCPYKFGDISHAIVATSELSPDELIGLDEEDEFDD
jgi:hypothetical protein